MLKAVLDTNVLVSALLKPESTPEVVLLLALNNQIRLYISDDIFNEYQQVFSRDKFKKYLDQKKIQIFLKEIKRYAVTVVPQESVNVVKVDPADNKFLECVLAAKADFFITGNIKHFPRKKFRKTRIVTPSEFLNFAAEAF